MKISVKVKPLAKRNEIRRLDNGIYEILVTSSPEKGKANKAVLELLAVQFRIRKSSIRIEKGQTSRNKIISIGE
jgi:uncharacterized protein (TIGR00251 family)